MDSFERGHPTCEETVCHTLLTDEMRAVQSLGDPQRPTSTQEANQLQQKTSPYAAKRESKPLTLQG